MERLGKYQITGELGKGGFGKVYRALDPTVGRVVAIKVLNAQDDENLVRRFRNEATTSANLQHRNIVTIHEFGEESGVAFLVMEYLDGTTLQRLIKDRAPLSMLEKLLIMSEVCRGLHYAHMHGIVHRDVKPANIMRLSDGSVKVMDFGIARVMQEGSSRLTQTGSMIGTIQYMSPEQFTTEGAGAQSDVWSFGVVLWEFLCGSNPFESASPLQVMFKITSEDPFPFPLSEQPAALSPLLRKLLAKPRNDRYPSMEEVQFDLDLVIHELKEGRVESLSRRAESLIQAEDTREALSVVRQILDLDQSNSTARRWRTELMERARLQNNNVRVRQLMEQAESAASSREYGAAVERLEEANRLDTSNSVLRARLDEVRAELEKVKRAMALVAEARLELEHEALTSALEHAGEAAAADPQNSDAQALLGQARDAMALREAEARRKGGLSKTKGLLQAEDYSGAARLLEDLAAAHPADPEIRSKLEETRGLEAAYLTRLKLEAGVVEAREMIRRGSYRRAIDLLSSLTPQPAEAPALLQFAREQLDAHTAANRRREDEARHLRSSLESCRTMLQAGNIDDALVRFTDLQSQFPEDAGVVELGEAVNRALEARTRAKFALSAYPRPYPPPPPPSQRIVEEDSEPAADQHKKLIVTVVGLVAVVALGILFLLYRTSSSSGTPTVTPAPVKQSEAPIRPAPAPPTKGASRRPPLRDPADPTPIPITVPNRKIEPPANAAAVRPVPAEGRVVWTGDLDTGQQIDLGSVSASSVVGALPGVPVSIEVHPPSLRVVTAPGPNNGWRRLVLRNDGKKVGFILVKWATIDK